MKGENMHDTEVNRRAKEVEQELCNMRKQWVNMYEIITRLIEDTTVEVEDDRYLDYNKCINCKHHDTDKNGIKCII